MPQANDTDTTTPADDRETFTDVMVELGTGIKTLISHLDKAFDAGFELELEVGRDVMDAIIATQWVARRLSDDIHAVGNDFDGTRSDAAEGLPMTRCFPRKTRDTTAWEAVTDLEEGVGMLIDRLEAAVQSFSEEDYGTDIVKGISPVFWIALRLQNDIADVSKKVDALYHPTREAKAAD